MAAASPRWQRRKRSPPSLLDLAIQALPWPRRLITKLPDLAPRLCLAICSCCGQRDVSAREYLLFSSEACDVYMEDNLLGGYELVDTSVSNIEKLCAKCYGTWKWRYARCSMCRVDDGIACSSLPIELLKVYELWKIACKDGVRTFAWLCDVHYTEMFTHPFDRENTIPCGEADGPLVLLDRIVSDLGRQRRKQQRKKRHQPPATVLPPPTSPHPPQQSQSSSSVSVQRADGDGVRIIDFALVDELLEELYPEPYAAMRRMGCIREEEQQCHKQQRQGK